MIPTDELEALRDAATLHMLPPEALIASIKQLAEDALEYRAAIGRVGLNILEGEFTLRDGSTSHLYLEKRVMVPDSRADLERWARDYERVNGVWPTHWIPPGADDPVPFPIPKSEVD